MTLWDTGLGFRLSMEPEAWQSASRVMSGFKFWYSKGWLNDTDLLYCLDYCNKKHPMTFAELQALMRRYAHACQAAWIKERDELYSVTKEEE